MKQLKAKPWFLFLLVVFFILHGTVENFGFINPEAVLKIGLSILACVAVFYLIIRAFTKDAVHAALICFFISTWILFFGAILDWVKGIRFLHWMTHYSVIIPFMLGTFLFFILFIRNKVNLQQKLSFYLNVLLLIYCVFDVSVLVFKLLQTNKPAISGTINFDISAVKSKPNVYFLLFDEYPGYKSLKDSFVFSNDRLYQFLEEKEFKMLPTFSNYNTTFYSMASMLNMNYIEKPFQPLHTLGDDQQRLQEIKYARAIQYFTAIGYSFSNYSIFDILDRPSVIENSFVVSITTLLTNKILFNRILADVGWNFISGKHKIPYVDHIYMHDDRSNQFIEKELSKIKPSKTLESQFIYAHFNMPHPPIFYDSIGNYLPSAEIFNAKTFFNKQKFLAYLKYTNKKIEDLVDVICKNDSSSIVIVMSDHGYRGYNNTSVIEPLQFDNICAVRFPGRNYLPFKEKWSNVNFFRYLFNCEFNQKIPYLSDSSIFLR